MSCFWSRKDPDPSYPRLCFFALSVRAFRSSAACPQKRRLIIRLLVLHHAYPDSTLESRLFEVQLTFYPMQHLIPDPVIAPQGNELPALSIEGGQL
jgi:hypothetical protein